jgi:hypothetical protein
MGGWFSNGNRWADYDLQCLDDTNRPYAHALRDAIVEQQIRESGPWHQDQGVPLFDDGTVSQFSFRAWGDFMAAVWSEHDCKDYCYMDFYC